MDARGGTDTVQSATMHRLRLWSDSLRTNFFFLPAIGVVAAFVAGRIAVGIDVGQWVGDATVDSARVVLSTVAAATITFASITFSVSLLIMQQGSNQFSPRVIEGLTRDPFNRRVIAIVVATFTYCLVVLQRVRGPLQDGGDEVVPRFAVALGVLLGIGSVLAVVAAIHHTSRQMDVSQILSRIVAQSVAAPSCPHVGDLEPGLAHDPPADVPSTVVRFASDGWIRQIDRQALLAAIAPGATARLETDTGRYAIRSTPVCSIWPAVPGERLDEVESAVRDTITLGPTRTMIEDSGYGVRQLVDVALKALSPGVNDPTTAQDAIFHLGTVLVDRLLAPPIPRAYSDDDGRQLLTPHAMTDDELAELAVAELRLAAIPHPTVCMYLLQMLGDVTEAARAAGAGHRTIPFVTQLDLLMAGIHRAELLPSDRSSLDRARQRIPDHAAMNQPPNRSASG
jgi:uncharacterized membrane protein